MTPEKRTRSVSEKLVLTFPAQLVREPIVYKLVKDYDLLTNIMRASISPDEHGHMVVELVGTRDAVRQGKEYLTRVGVNVEPLASDVRWIEDRCTHCTACVSVCPTAALAVDRKTMLVRFIAEKCIGCGLCIPACSYGAMEIRV